VVAGVITLPFRLHYPLTGQLGNWTTFRPPESQSSVHPIAVLSGIIRISSAVSRYDALSREASQSFGPLNGFKKSHKTPAKQKFAWGGGGGQSWLYAGGIIKDQWRQGPRRELRVHKVALRVQTGVDVALGVDVGEKK